MRCKNANVFVLAPASFCGARRRLWWMIDAMLLVVDRIVTCGRGSKQGTELGQICHTPSQKEIPRLPPLMLPWLLSKSIQLIYHYAHFFPINGNLHDSSVEGYWDISNSWNIKKKVVSTPITNCLEFFVQGGLWLVTVLLCQERKYLSVVSKIFI